MTQTADPDRTWHFDILLCDGFVLTELAAVLDPLRIANRSTAQPHYSWTYLSRDGGLRKNGSGIMVETQAVPDRPQADFLFVLGNSDPDHPDLSVAPLLRRYRYSGAKVFLLAEAAARFIQEEGAENGLDSAHATHWENSHLLREQHGVFNVGNTLVSDTGTIVTCAGMEATVDVVLALIKQHISSAVGVSVANVLLHDTVRDGSTLQPNMASQLPTTGDSGLDRCIRLMQDHIEEPMTIAHLTETLGISPRSLERKFKSRLGCSPVTFYREIRLHRANNLLLNSSLSICEVGLACGFGSGFSNVYKSFFGKTPSALRRERAQAPLAD